MSNSNKWGFVRETRDMASKGKTDKGIGIGMTGLEDYLAVIFPEVPLDKWVHDKPIHGIGKRIRPDYRCDELNLIVEFDGLQHYQQPDKILTDWSNQKFYESIGFQVVRIPYFIQLTNDVVKTMFGRNVQEELFDAEVHSMAPEWRNTPAWCCPLGIERMAKEFHQYPQQYNVNLVALKACGDEQLSGVDILEKIYNTL